MEERIIHLVAEQVGRKRRTWCGVDVEGGDKALTDYPYRSTCPSCLTVWSSQANGVGKDRASSAKPRR